MKTVLLTFVLSLGILGYSQDNLSAVKFIFDSQEKIEQELSKNIEEKQFTFTVDGILTPDHRKLLIKNVRKVRGVVSFNLDDDNNATLVLYSFAKDWRYWSMFIKHSRIGGIKINETLYTKETIRQLNE